MRLCGMAAGEKPKTRRQMLAEYAREVSVLILVFGLLDPLFHDPVVPVRARSSLSFLANSDGQIHPVTWYGAVILGSVVLLFYGMHLERRR